MWGSLSLSSVLRWILHPAEVSSSYKPVCLTSAEGWKQEPARSPARCVQQLLFFFLLFLETIQLYEDTRGFVPLERDLALSIGIKNKSLLVSLLHYYIFPDNACERPEEDAALGLTQMVGLGAAGCCGCSAASSHWLRSD